LLASSDGSLWLSSHSNVIKRWKDGAMTKYSLPRNLTPRINQLYEDPQGTIWVGRSRRSQPAEFKYPYSSCSH
jgi:streptogramin lyase